MKTLTTILICAAFSYGFLPARDKITKKDLIVLTGEQWKGKLTYLDYSSGKRTIIPARLIVKQAADNASIFYFFYEYPDEPQANNMDTVTLSKDGKKINEAILMKKERVGNILKIITEVSDNKDGEIKSFRFTYLIGSNLFSIKKEEKRLTDTAWLTRNIYEYQRR